MSTGSRASLGWIAWLSFVAACASADGGDSGSRPDAERVCSTIGCVDGLAITLDADRWPEGDYAFAVRVDQTTVTCSGALPLPDCGTPAVRCDGPGVDVGESGCALPPPQHAFSEIFIDAHPTEVEVRLDFAGKTAVTYTSKPVYRTVRPNGPECEPTCAQAGIRMKIPTLRRPPPPEPPATDPRPERVGQTTACLAPPPVIPAGLPDEARTCLESLVAARGRFGFVEPTTPTVPPCGVDEIDADGVITRRGRVVRFDARQREVVFDSTDESGQRTVVTDTRVLDAKGRERSVVRLWDTYLEDEAAPDCSNPTTTRHRRNGKGWPTRTTKVIETCEGVDAGTITTNRTFERDKGFVAGAMRIVDRGSRLRATGWWLPDPAAAVAHGSTDQYDDTSCTLQVIGCGGARLGRLERGNGLSAVRNRYRCDAGTSP